ncbi:hypothetical protein AMQ84_27210 [Paenibacillus riograndensis]|uniref:Uncharacterized protein n=1 Tax=Paenibacillus riograndensis TaxID=483937 RepID=A0A132TK91_9BACL|nr:hypothetical protein [Paenibacillus riograndensis]KWX71613.1 hypothetical protein AMQ84_27210 [Paenibacillus riograndensis]
MTALITFICLTLASAIAAGAFVYGRQIGYTKRDAELREADLKTALEQLEQLSMENQQLNMQMQQDRRDSARTTQPGWDPGMMTGRYE